MNRAPSFPNVYVVKKVAEADSKSCSVCYKPSAMVMLSENKGDFFYLCPSHLDDPNFSVAIESEEYVELKHQKSEIEKKVQVVQRDMEANKPYNWSRLAQRVGLGRKDDSGDSSHKEEADKKAEDMKAEDKKKNTPEDKYKELEKELTILNVSLKDTLDKLGAFKFSKYALDKNIYKMRLQNQFKAKLAQKREQELHSPGFFPSVPTNSIGKSDS